MAEAGLRHDCAAALDFLRRFHPGRPWVLTSIAVDRKGISTETFDESRVADMATWLDRHSADNVYFSVAEPLQAVRKKMEKADVRAVHWLHVDVDPRAGEPVAQERERILRMLLAPPGLPPPTLITSSGGGYWGFWRLDAPVMVDGLVERAEDTELYTKSLELALEGGDHCGNVDRISRLPGTVNWPDEKKRKRGQAPEPARVVEWHEDRVYPLGAFRRAERKRTAPTAAAAAGSTGTIRRFASVDDLPSTVSDRVKVIIVQGRHPDEPPKEPKDSDSEWMFDAVCNMLREGCSEDDVLGIITDPSYAISAHVLRQASPEEYARRQVERGMAQSLPPELEEMNSLHAVIADSGGKCRILSEVQDFVGGRPRSRISYQSFGDFRNRYANRFAVSRNHDGDEVRVPLAEWWVSHPRRRQYETVVFAPAFEARGCYNLWQGWAVEPRMGSCARFLEHVRENVCAGDQVSYDYLVRWMATAVQHPARPGGTAVVLRGGQGVGKGTFAKAFGSLFGRHFMQVSDSKHLVGSFNAHLRDCLVLFADEAFYAGDRRHAAILKMLVTEEALTVEKKGFDAEQASNYVHLIMASNEEWVIPAGMDDRRFFVLDVGEAHKQDEAYFGAIEEELASGGREALMHFLSSLDLGGFSVRQLPKTDALQEQKTLSLKLEEEWWLSKLEAGEVFEGQGWPPHVFATELAHDFLTSAGAWQGGSLGSMVKLGFFMRRVLPRDGAKVRINGKHPVTQIDGVLRHVERPWGYRLPSLEECRRHWSALQGGTARWTEVECIDVRPRESDAPF